MIFSLITIPQAAAIERISVCSGGWNQSSSWSPYGVPDAGDNVIIASGHAITINSNPTMLTSLTINGTLIIGNNGLARNITLTGDWINNGSFIPGISTVIFAGNVSQQIAGLSATSFHSITINNSAGVILGNTITIAGEGQFTAGVVTGSNSNLVIFNDDATTSGANNGAFPSYVSGPVKKIGNDGFVFPTGSVGAGYHPCAISAPLFTTDAFTAEYFRGSAANLGVISAPGLHQVSNCEYWSIKRTNGLSPANVTLYWNGYSGCNASVYVNSIAALVVASFNGVVWNLFGANSYAGTATNGNVTLNAVSFFDRFTLGSNSPSANPLPVRFSLIEATAQATSNRIEWINSSEVNTLEYRLEKSKDGINFEQSAQVVPKGNAGLAEKYEFNDTIQLNKYTYYRIAGVNLTGEINYSKVVFVERKSTSSGLSVYPNPVTRKQVTVRFIDSPRSHISIKMLNTFGQQVYMNSIKPSVNASVHNINLPEHITPGIYLLVVSADQNIFKTKVIVE